MYHFKQNIDLSEFLNFVRRCNADVYFKTQDGDNLNLKSALSHYVLMIIANNTDFLSNGIIHCEDTNDYELLKDYIERH